MKRLLCIGDLNGDIAITTKDGIVPGSDTTGSVRLSGGGSAANVAATAARVGRAEVGARFVGVVGDDLIGRFLVDELTGHGVEVRPVVRDGTASRSIAVVVDASGERSMVSDIATATVLTVADVEASWFDDVDWLHLTAYSWFAPGGPKVLRALIELANERDIPYSIDPSSAEMLGTVRPITEALAAFRGAAVLFPNEDEALRLTGCDDLSVAVRELLDLAEIVVVTRGASGALVAERGGRQQQFPAPAVAVVNALGAGDAFAAGFLATRLAGGTVADCVTGALDAASRVVASPGSR